MAYKQRKDPTMTTPNKTPASATMTDPIINQSNVEAIKASEVTDGWWWAQWDGLAAVEVKGNCILDAGESKPIAELPNVKFIGRIPAPHDANTPIESGWWWMQMSSNDPVCALVEDGTIRINGIKWSLEDFTMTYWGIKFLSRIDSPEQSKAKDEALKLAMAYLEKLEVLESISDGEGGEVNACSQCGGAMVYIHSKGAHPYVAHRDQCEVGRAITAIKLALDRSVTP